MQTALQITGMHCASCKKLIENVVKDIPGVLNCVVDFENGKAMVEHDESVTVQKLKEEIQALGKYSVQTI